MEADVTFLMIIFLRWLGFTAYSNWIRDRNHYLKAVTQNWNRIGKI